jgi:hypothetical protein
LLSVSGGSDEWPNGRNFFSPLVVAGQVDILGGFLALNGVVVVVVVVVVAVVVVVDVRRRGLKIVRAALDACQLRCFCLARVESQPRRDRAALPTKAHLEGGDNTVVQFHCRDPVGWGAWKIKWFKSRWGDAVENIRLRLALERKHVTANYSLPTLRWAPTSHLPACFSTNHYYEVHFEETRLPASHTKPGIVPANRQPKQHMWVIRSGGVDSRKDLVHKYIGHDQENLAVQKYQGFVIQQAARIYGLQRSLQPAIPR